MTNSNTTFQRWRYLAPLITLLVLVAVALFYFSGKSDIAAGNSLSPVQVPASQQRTGDAAKGKDYLLSGNYVSCGLPERIYRQSGLARNALQLKNRSGAGADLAYANNLVKDEDGNLVVTNNCLTCHASTLFGKVIVGLGNEFLDFTDNPSRSIEAAGLLIQSSAEESVWRKYADRIAAIAPYSVSSTVGVNVANNLTAALMSHLDPETLSWSIEPLIDPPDFEPLPVSVPPWWRMKKKHAMFYQGQWRGDHSRIMVTAALLCIDSVAELQEIDKHAADLSAFIKSLQAPEFPFDVDSAKAAAGKIVFEKTCSGCHGRYGVQGNDSSDTYPNILVPLDIIGTDPALAIQTAVDYERFNRWFRDSWFYQDTDVVPAQAYSAPPLDGVWATAPFLHNGSVPSIATLLMSDTRPAYWKHAPEREYDQAALGWTFESLNEGKASTSDFRKSRLIYDTTLRGYGNSGHQFGDTLSNAERLAVIEYLKTI